MQIRAEYHLRAVVRPGDDPFVASPLPGVTRLMLDREGGEVARATTIVRYARGSRFSSHDHAMGEEFLVLAGVFCDEHGAYPAGTYVRNPPGSHHAPFSTEGCMIFVKLRQFAPDDRKQLVVDTTTAAWQNGSKEGDHILPLHHHDHERVAMIRLGAGSRYEPAKDQGGTEILIIEGMLYDGASAYPGGSWLRLPAGDCASLSTREGCTFYIKSGHLG